MTTSMKERRIDKKRTDRARKLTLARKRQRRMKGSAS